MWFYLITLLALAFSQTAPLPNSTVTTISTKLKSDFVLVTIKFPHYPNPYSWIISPYPSLFVISDELLRINSITFGSFEKEVINLDFNDTIPRRGIPDVTTLIYDLLGDKARTNFICFNDPESLLWSCCQDSRMNFNSTCNNPIPHRLAFETLFWTQELLWILPASFFLFFAIVFVFLVITSRLKNHKHTAIQNEEQRLIPPDDLEESPQVRHPSEESTYFAKFKNLLPTRLIDIASGFPNFVFPLLSHPETITLVNPLVPVIVLGVPVSNLFPVFTVWFIIYAPSLYLAIVLWSTESIFTFAVIIYLIIETITMVIAILFLCSGKIPSSDGKILSFISTILATISVWSLIWIPLVIHAYWTITLAFMISLFLAPVATAYRIGFIIFLLSLLSTTKPFLYGDFPTVLGILVTNFGEHFQEDEQGSSPGVAPIVTVSMFFRICEDLDISWKRQTGIAISFLVGGGLFIGTVLTPIVIILFSNITEATSSMEPIYVIIAGFLPKLFGYFQTNKIHDSAFIERVKRAAIRQLKAIA